ncbi:MAG TPA: CvpA family protein [Elusimicrobiota bacterium]|nr:CvpA family protein [Elusimicrobiota bacterium]
MNIDLIVAALILLSAISGYYSGAVRQLSHWIALAAAFLFHKRVAAAVVPVVAGQTGGTGSFASVVVRLMIFPLIMFLAGLLARGILNAIEPGDERGPLDQGLGIFVGLTKGAALLYLFGCIVIGIEEPLAKMGFDLRPQAKSSSFLAYAREHNVFELPAGAGIKRLLPKKS